MYFSTPCLPNECSHPTRPQTSSRWHATSPRVSSRRAGDAFRVTGSKAWVTHGGDADFYTLFARTSDHRSRGISCFLAPGQADGLTCQQPERKMGLTGSTTATVDFDDVELGADRL